ncbi:tetratricopeptide repeat protein [Aneurinibacillus soli]|uniref:Tetratricopeptide repeat protein n=1 Tax=Aneurinibacillus soli TaxID=1500254 RepID=A0A0U5BF15_9BACL|nr:tetratricopeptide repeat protein [Aneurinibacillus soli]PYE63087.1 tetratricopeptide repeat protein [Aneurinibacillus soli]BAU28855.1 Tetratricopeptide repeat protein [Aneurinibacillus soli]
MLLTHYFSTLIEQLTKIEAAMKQANPERRQALYLEVLHLRTASDRIVEEWLRFEEKLVSVQRAFETEESEEDCLVSNEAGAIDKGDSSASSSNSEIYLSRPLAMRFRQGQGYFTLSMYEQAVQSFAGVVEEAPDMEIARLYLAFGFWLSRRQDVASAQFHLLLQTSSHAFIQAASASALGCIAALDGQTEQSLVLFEQALAAYPAFTDARYNYALALAHAGRFRDAARAVEPLLNETEEPDADVLLLLAACYVEERQTDCAAELLGQADALVLTADQQDDIAHMYEQIHRYADAVRCYRGLLAGRRDDADVWHGLGWSLWQEKREGQAALYLQYALTLAPKRPDYACSYAWVLLEMGDSERADRIFQQIEKEYVYPLARAGRIELLLRAQRMKEAIMISEELLGHEDEEARSLAHYHLGRIALAEGRHDDALHHFTASKEEGIIPESGLYAGFVHYTNGKQQEAWRFWS